ncbi:hypothetical protein DM860_000423 [Cuscuta australis]|uniref:Protein kinase domain-containing protein n=1 Tax=Cuscuta australis TaxID=267555 RepID=A0A328D067_9ASTE|nr:hypothetical protein DM860_000423 [Cuscuta australis]
MAAAEEKCGALNGKYELGRLLGHGTFAKVYHARNLVTGKSVAMKVVGKEKVIKQNEDLLRHGAGPRRRAVRRHLQGPPAGGRGEELLPAADLRHRLLPQPRRLPPGLEAGEPPPGRGGTPEGDGFRAQRVLRPPPAGRDAPHDVRHAGVRRAGGDSEEGVRRCEGGHMVLRGDPLRPPCRIPPLPRRQHRRHVQEDLQRGLQMPALVLAGGQETGEQDARPEPEFQNQHSQNHVLLLVQEMHSPATPEDELLQGRRRAQRVGDAERLPHHIPVAGVRPEPLVSREEGGRERGDEIRDGGAGEQRDIEAGSGGENEQLQREEERGLEREAAGAGEREEGQTGNIGGYLRHDAVVCGGGGEEIQRRHAGIRPVLQQGAEARFERHCLDFSSSSSFNSSSSSMRA